MNKVRATLIVPARNEKETIHNFLEKLSESVSLNVEVLIIVDSLNDTTIPAIPVLNSQNLTFACVLNHLGEGPANAIRYGISIANSEVIVVTMADGSDDPSVIDSLIRLVERGCAMVVASRYMPGGQQIGGPRLKKFLSINASRILRLFAGIGIHDATNSYRAFSKEFAGKANIESTNGFEIGLELTAKAHRNKQIVAEIPTIWIDRQFGNSKFRLIKWLPGYLRWFFYSFGVKPLNTTRE
jgi:dolichol-phosphate mannosyltransferase